MPLNVKHGRWRACVIQCCLKVSDHFSEDDTQYLVMGHISGDDLAKRLEGAKKPFPLNLVLLWANELLDALAYLHTHEPPIVHRDIKLSKKIEDCY